VENQIGNQKAEHSSASITQVFSYPSPEGEVRVYHVESPLEFFIVTLVNEAGGEFVWGASHSPQGATWDASQLWEAYHPGQVNPFLQVHNVLLNKEAEEDEEED